ncbi:MAG: CGNR zinc finger domain-containing protein [Pseudomonadales bacterium]
MSKVPSQSAFDTGLDALMEPSSSKLAETLVRLANEGDELATGWIERIRSKGASKSVLADIDAHVRGVQIVTYPKLSASERKFTWARKFPEGEEFRDREAAIALLLARLVNDEYLTRLHRCQLDDCGNYFVGDPRSKWCSTRCGSISRMRIKRRRDRQ